jgi:hypothetical protein
MSSHDPIFTGLIVVSWHAVHLWIDEVHVILLTSILIPPISQDVKVKIGLEHKG